MTRVLDVRDLRISFPASDGSRFHPVDGVSFCLDRGETLALVGESGCGKSLTSLALLRLIPPPGRIDPGSAIRLGETDVLTLEGEALRQIRGRRIGMIFQDPMTSLNPVFTAGDQIAEAVRAHLRVSKAEARERALRAAAGGRDSRPGGAARRLSAPAERRDAAAGDDRDCPRRRAGDPRGRRADDRAGRDGAGADSRGARRAAAAARDGGAAHHPRPRDRGGPGGPGGGNVRGADRRGGNDGDLFARPSHPYTQGLFASVPRITRAGAAAHADRRHRSASPRVAGRAAGSGRAARRPSRRASSLPSCCRWDRTTACAAGWPRASGRHDAAPRGARPRQALHRRRPLRAGRAAGPGGGRRLVRRRPGRDAGAGRRERVRQVLGGPNGSAAAGADRRRGEDSRASTSSGSTAPRSGGFAAGCRSSSRIPTAASIPG